MSSVIALTTLFLTALLAATVFPMQSEAVLTGMLVATDLAPWLLVAVASLGNVLGSVINWCLGRWIVRFEGESWFPVKRAALAKAEGWYRRYGRWSLLLSWVPLIGDPLTVVAGVLREPLPLFLLLVTIAKVGRYIVLALVVQGLL